MSSDYSRPFNGVVPELVEDVNLKRARIETSDGGAAIRVTATAADLAPITDALGTQQDPVETPTVIGLLKNLIASGGGSGGGGSANYPLFKMQWNSISWRTSGSSETQDLATLLSNQEQTIPDWTKYIVFIEKDSYYKHQCAIFPFITESGEVTFTFTSVSSYSSGNLTVYTYTLGWTNYEDADLTHNQISLTPGHSDAYLVNDTTSVLGFIQTRTEPEYRQIKSYYVLFFDTDPTTISGGGGSSGDAVSTYSFTLNNVNTTTITAPVSDPASDDDKTLVSLGYLKDLINNAHLQRRQLLLTGQITQLRTGTAYNLESTFNITIPSWVNRLRIGYQISTFGTTQNFIEFGTLGGTFSTFSINNGTGTLFGVNLTYSNKTLTINRVMSLTTSDDDWNTNTNTFGLISITAYGSFSF